MAARAISSATVSFGLVSIPIKIYSSNAAETGIHFNLLHEKCKTRLKQQYICPTDSEVVPRDNMVKGYEFEKGQYVTFTDEELDALEEQATKSLEITEFVPLHKVDPLYFEKTYYLGPDKGGDRAYKLLREAMRETGRAAVAKYAARGKQYIVLVRPFGDGLVLQQLRYYDEIKPFAEVPLGEGEVKPKELELAVQLIEQIATEEFQPAGYEDEVKKRVQQAIEAKMAGREVVKVAEEPKAQIIDIMEALKASLGQIGETGETSQAEEIRAPAKRAAGKTAREKKPAGKEKRVRT